MENNLNDSFSRPDLYNNNFPKDWQPFNNSSSIALEKKLIYKETVLPMIIDMIIDFLKKTWNIK